LSQAVSAALRETPVKALQREMCSGELPGCLGLSFGERGEVACDCVTTQRAQALGRWLTGQGLDIQTHSPDALLYNHLANSLWFGGGGIGSVGR
jgi:hypothetical protein